MKNLVKIAAVAVLSLGFGFAANAQGTGQGNGEISASATVLGNIEVVEGDNLAFGQVMPGLDKYVPMIDGNLNAVNAGTGTVNLVGVSSGFFKVFAATGSSVVLDLDFSGLLSGTTPLTLDFNDGLVDGSNTTTLAWGSETLAPTKMIIGDNAIKSFPSSPLDSKNGIYVYVGGTVRPAADQAAGIYTGTMTLVATYN
jgi:hypothetical protein